MTKIKKIIFGIWGIMAVVLLPLAQAQNVSTVSTNDHSRQWIQEVYTELNLTDDQKKQLETNKQQQRVEMEGARQQVKTNKEVLKAELMKAQLDMAKINEIHQRIKSLQDQMEDDKLKSILAVREILTTDQFVKFIGLMKKHRQSSEKQGD